MPFPKTHKTKRGTDLGGSRVRARKGKKKSRDLLKHVKFEILGRRQGGDAETVDGYSNLGFRSQAWGCGNNNRCSTGPYCVPGTALCTSCT